ncbi:FadR/GntR family transcriptional regulator [Streptomyces profundus]|uniref:FadR/GntR family transcriptional regulator n=1 Tax=Streptomyces profundus TaxID=2867410 RepID=UPI001D160426|nr:FCD domain-containing protein [Streptomyces sp. MA3_2.13]UED83810.1 GntR family transcriptional regulator [Streptomyces sp. MA3_2.13]
MLRRSRSVGAEVAAHLERLITSGELAAGDRLPAERELAASLQVSRASLREAMFELESKKLIERHQGRGSVVADISEDVAQLYENLSELDVEIANATELRDLVEPRIAQLAALRAADSNLLSLEDVLARSQEDLGPAESLALDVEFHTLLAHAAQNPLLVTLCTMTTNWTRRTRELSHETEQGRRISVEGHRAIYGAVVARRPAPAGAAMERHLREIRAISTEHGHRRAPS